MTHPFNNDLAARAESCTTMVPVPETGGLEYEECRNMQPRYKCLTCVVVALSDSVEQESQR